MTLLLISGWRGNPENSLGFLGCQTRPA